MDTGRGEADATAYAHTAAEPRAWEPYADHRDLVTRYAGEFAAAFDARAWGETLGRWHDLGKLSAEWQAYLRISGGDPDAGEEEATASPATTTPT